MKKIFLTFLLVVGLFISSKAQERETNPKQVQYIYKTSTRNSLEELANLVKGDKDMYEKAYKKFKQLEKLGKVMLSTKEYAPIKAKIESISLNPSNPAEFEEIKYAQKAVDKYVVITDLLK